MGQVIVEGKTVQIF